MTPEEQMMKLVKDFNGVTVNQIFHLKDFNLIAIYEFLDKKMKDGVIYELKDERGVRKFYYEDCPLKQRERKVEYEDNLFINDFKELIDKWKFKVPKHLLNWFNKYRSEKMKAKNLF